MRRVEKGGVGGYRSWNRTGEDGSIYAKEEMVQRLLEKYKKARKKTTVIHD